MNPIVHVCGLAYIWAATVKYLTKPSAEHSYRNNATTNLYTLCFTSLKFAHTDQKQRELLQSGQVSIERAELGQALLQRG